MFQSPPPSQPKGQDCDGQAWDRVYASKGAAGVSWFQASPGLSLEWIQALCPDRSTTIIDVGSGASTLVDCLLNQGYRHITLLDCSALALSLTCSRLQADRQLSPFLEEVNWCQGDLLQHDFPSQAFDLWHDRAVFHFLTTEWQRQRYRSQLQRALRPGGILMVSTFSEDGPSQCSGRSVRRYGLDDLVQAVGPGFSLVQQQRESHRPPAGDRQSFLSACFRWLP